MFLCIYMYCYGNLMLLATIKIITLKLYCDKLHYLSFKEVVQKRTEILSKMNRDAFFPLKAWLQEMQLLFWKKRIGDVETLFCQGNGCSPDLICPWILLSQSWAPDETKKWVQQVDFVLNNMDKKKSPWYYFYDAVKCNLITLTTKRGSSTV